MNNGLHSQCLHSTVTLPILNNDIEQDEFCIQDDPCAVSDKYLCGEELEELILEEENVFDIDLPKMTSHTDAFNDFSIKKHLKCFEIFSPDL